MNIIYWRISSWMSYFRLSCCSGSSLKIILLVLNILLVIIGASHFGCKFFDNFRCRTLPEDPIQRNGARKSHRSWQSLDIRTHHNLHSLRHIFGSGQLYHHIGPLWIHWNIKSPKMEPHCPGTANNRAWNMHGSCHIQQSDVPLLHWKLHCCIELERKHCWCTHWAIKGSIFRNQKYAQVHNGPGYN